MRIGHNYSIMMHNLGCILCVLLTCGVYSVQSEVCDIDKVEKCKAELISYETVDFPFYGSDDDELDETCRAMNKTLECLQDFVYNCVELPQCGDDCPPAVAQIASLWRNTGVPSLYGQLCTEDHPYRQSYLAHYSCLEKTIDDYAVCHNSSQYSQEYILTLYEDPEIHLEATCCFFSWHRDCYTNATMDTCGANATFVVSFALHLLTGHIVTHLCNPLPFCDKPPMPRPDISQETTTITTVSGAPESCTMTNLLIVLASMHFIRSFTKY